MSNALLSEELPQQTKSSAWTGERGGVESNLKRTNIHNSSMSIEMTSKNTSIIMVCIVAIQVNFSFENSYRHQHGWYMQV